MMRSLTPLLLLIPLLAGAADDKATKAAKERAGELLDQGLRSFEEGQNEAALTLFEAAYAAYPSPKILYNVGKTQHVLGKHVEAAKNLEKFLAESGFKPGSDQYRFAMAELKAVDKKIGKISFEGTKGTEVVIGETAFGTLPRAPIRVAPGKHNVSARLPDHSDWQEQITVAPGKTVPVRIFLAPIAKKMPPPKKELIVTAPPPEQEEDSVLGAWWFWAAVGAVALTATGVAIAATTGGEAFDRSAELDVSNTDGWNRVQ